MSGAGMLGLLLSLTVSARVPPARVSEEMEVSGDSLMVSDIRHWTPREQATREREGTTTRLEPGDDLGEGDVLRTGGTSVTVTSSSQEWCILYPTEVVLVGSRRLALEDGELYCEVSGFFEVLIRDVLIGVKGTRFLVAYDASGVSVKVSEGLVEVSRNGEALVSVPADMQVSVPGPGPAHLRPWPTLERWRTLARAWPLRRPPLQLGGMLEIGTVPLVEHPSLDGGARGFARILLLPQLQLEYSLGVRTAPNTLSPGLARDSLRIPQGFGLQAHVGPVALVGQGIVEMELLGGFGVFSQLGFLRGAAVAGRYAVPLGRRGSLETELRATWLDHDTFTVTTGIGFAVGTSLPSSPGDHGMVITSPRSSDSPY